jgi:hypothetical protein
MGRASSNKKVSRAARTAGRPGASRNVVWPAAVAAVVLLGVALVMVSRPERGEALPPRIGDHWHAAYGINVCGEWLPPLQDREADTTGIHTHGDGLIHMHPFSTRYTGEGANLEAFGQQAGVEIGDGTLTLPDGRQLRDGDDCGGEAGVVQVKVWDGPDDTEGRWLDGDLAAHAPQNMEIVAIAFLPEGADLEPPATAARLADPLAAEEGRPPVPLDEVPDAPESGIVEEVEPGADASPEEGEGGFIEEPQDEGAPGGTAEDPAP